MTNPTLPNPNVGAKTGRSAPDIRFAPQPIAMYNPYRKTLRLEMRKPPNRWTFKSDPGYREVVEHVTPEQGQSFLNWAFMQGAGMWSPKTAASLAARNDSLGTPIQHHYPDMGITCSPSNWRYLCHAIKVWHYVELLGLDKVHVVELGGGYGGLALFIHGLRPHRLASYAIIDLPEATAIQQAYARTLHFPLFVANGLDANAIHRVMPPADKVPILFVSAYAFSEFDQATRDWYAEQVIQHCDRGLIVWNFPDPVLGMDGRQFGGPVYAFTDRPIHCEPDEPELYAGHQLVTF